MPSARLTALGAVTADSLWLLPGSLVLGIFQYIPVVAGGLGGLGAWPRGVYLGSLVLVWAANGLLLVPLICRARAKGAEMPNRMPRLNKLARRALRGARMGLLGGLAADIFVAALVATHSNGIALGAAAMLILAAVLVDRACP